MDGTVSDAVKKERCRLLREMGDSKNRDFHERMTGRTLKAVAIGKKPRRDGALTLMTNNYLKALLPDPPESLFPIFPVKVLSFFDDILLVKVIS